MDIVEFAEKRCGTKLFDWQKDILRECQKKKQFYITIPPFNGKTHYKLLSLMAKAIIEQEETE